jgi:hypothetical protein
MVELLGAGLPLHKLMVIPGQGIVNGLGGGGLQRGSTIDLGPWDRESLQKGTKIAKGKTDS